jgi:predicted nucleic acid-binding protein
VICVDTSSLLALWAGDEGGDTLLLEGALTEKAVALSPVTVSEVLSAIDLPVAIEERVLGMPLLEITPGYWARAGKLRAKLMQHRYRPKIADTLIAQSCLDHRVSLITRDRDFAAFQKIAGLRLL